MGLTMYDPFERGPLRVTVESWVLDDPSRHRAFPCQTWTPAGSRSTPLVLYSHSSGGDRTSSTFLCEHLATHGYTVAALDHSERVAADRPADVPARIEWMISNRVPDIRLLLDHLGGDRTDAGLVGHSFGGWTVLATPEVDNRVSSVVALAPAGSRNPRPGIIPATLTFRWRRLISTLIVAGDTDASTPLAGIREIYERTPEPRRLMVLRGADHMHFVDDVACAHEEMRTLSPEGELSWIAEMQPIQSLRPPEEAHRLVRGLTLAHFDSTLRGLREAEEFLSAAATMPAM